MNIHDGGSKPTVFIGGFSYTPIHDKYRVGRGETNVYLEHSCHNGKQETRLCKVNELDPDDMRYLHKYHILQTELSKKPYHITLDEDIERFGYNDIRYVCVDIIPLDVYGIVLASDVDLKRDVMLSYPLYVSGETLYTREKGFERSHKDNTVSKNIRLIIDALIQSIQGEYDELRLRTKFSESQLSPRNITISRIEDTTLYLTCTDIGGSIRRLVANNERYIQQLMTANGITFDQFFLFTDYRKQRKELEVTYNNNLISEVFGTLNS